MIRPDLLKGVWQSLGLHQYLSQEDFTVQEYDNAGDLALKIEYRYDSNLFFRFDIPTGKTGDGNYRFNCVMRPGYESVEESLGANSRSALKSELKQWLSRLHDDVVALPIGRQLHEHEHAIEQLRERLAVLPDEPIARRDVEVFSENLEKLKAEFLEQLEKESASTKQLNEKVAELTRDIDFLKDTLGSMTKRRWIELLVSRVQRWRSRFSLPQIAAGAKALRLLMPSEAADVLDSVAGEVGDIAEGVEEPPDGETTEE